MVSCYPGGRPVELGALEESGTWVRRDAPQGRHPLRSKFVFKRKLGADVKIEKYKAGLVVKGFSQKSGVDFGDSVYALVAHYETILVTLSTMHVCSPGLRCSSDRCSKSAFLNATLEKTLVNLHPFFPKA